MSVVLLENVRSCFNVGSIFRLADAVGVSELLLSGYTPCPLDRMGRVNDRLLKTSLGAEKSVSWRQVSSVSAALVQYSDLVPVAVEQTASAVSYRTFSFEDRSGLFIFGNEVDGVSSETLSLVSSHLFLPMQGKKESLNVSTCAAVILYHFLSA